MEANRVQASGPHRLPRLGMVPSSGARREVDAMSLEGFQVYAVLPASDYERAKAWYQDKLGLVPAEETGPNGWYRMADGTWFILTLSGNAGTAKNTAAGFTVRDIGS